MLMAVEACSACGKVIGPDVQPHVINPNDPGRWTTTTVICTPCRQHWTPAKQKKAMAYLAKCLRMMHKADLDLEKRFRRKSA
jgi:hypothetical protein